MGCFLEKEISRVKPEGRGRRDSPDEWSWDVDGLECKRAVISAIFLASKIILYPMVLT
jgi:hypothetical protein